MEPVREQLGRLAQRLVGADKALSIRRIVEEILRIEEEWSDGADLDEVRLEAFQALMAFTHQDQQSAENALLQDLLPLCLRPREQWKSRELYSARPGLA
jgi:hypothetical protein